MELLQNIKYAQGKKNQIFENDLFLSLYLSSCEHHINLIKVYGDNNIYSLRCKCVEDEHCEFCKGGIQDEMASPLKQSNFISVGKTLHNRKNDKNAIVEEEEKNNFGKL